ncbi:GNAT family N-acetyltransferase [Roseivirga pacifica]|uniref:GNAT family N-acetyltransferase n=1 Tax=Roseivirga pacifica TaxID=1267423 RepID=UPI002094F05F|nr:GNAT family N-acetyltransferase [Roseivirga pacifica]MCO6359953.1 GNAT family N-acetyltransferase [Roseivirga pacifica]MCO6367323.1 GNAT family N-acetyltransferase [Roseivirga pacifica]MCO6370145.1 GNAT family N-acetyltransferase [Roseivirga pacifica]MCO6374980.1 GNAT family N-acetyltransferase [Roseivirga pacifica]MCO6380238.1 GNAT family N-acetyltransferase [Roseivirga pacifica]
MKISIEPADMRVAIKVLSDLPEFDPMFELEYYNSKIKTTDHLILVASVDGQPVGCKLGYDRFKDGSFYSWLGGVLPDYRNLGIAKKLAQAQEKWVKEKGYACIKFKTLNRHKNMLQFALNNGFSIYNVKPQDELENYRIELIKHF